MIKKLLIANRGEIACRIQRSAKSLGIATVAVFSEADAESLHVANADEAIPVGPAKATESYLKIENILAAARDTGADAVHPGYGFLAENTTFARAVDEAGMQWVGPTPEQIEAMGDKERARQIAADAGVPVLPGSERLAVGATDGLSAAAATVGFPLLVKASAGGGGIGMRLVNDESELAKTVEATQTLAERAFGDGTVFLERYVPKARHVEIQVFGFGDGRAVHFFERDCSIQRRFQKVIEESPAPGLADDTRAQMTAAAVALAEAQSYRGAGTVEFILDADTQAFYFLEMNTRIQVEHPVSEMVCDVDLVGLQLRLAAGEDLSSIQQAGISQTGHAIECRLYAENPDKMFLPSPGTLDTLQFASENTDVRIETGVRQGDKVTPYYDPMLAKLVCRGDNRNDACQRMREILAATKVDGIITNLAFLDRVIQHDAFASGDVFTGFIDAYKSDLIG